MNNELKLLIRAFEAGEYSENTKDVCLPERFIDDIAGLLFKEYNVSADSLKKIIPAVWFRPSLHSFEGDMDFILEMIKKFNS